MDIADAIDEYNRTKRQRGEPVMTQKLLAELAGVAPESVSRHARGHMKIAPATLEAYRRVLRLDPGRSHQPPHPNDTRSMTMPQVAADCKPVKFCESRAS